MTAIAPKTAFSTWKPQTTDTLDLRLAFFMDEKHETALITKKAKEMGKN